MIPRALPLLKDRQKTPPKQGALNVGEAVGTCLTIVQREVSSAENGKPAARFKRPNAAIEATVTRPKMIDAAIKT